MWLCVYKNSKIIYASTYIAAPGRLKVLRSSKVCILFLCLTKFLYGSLTPHMLSGSVVCMFVSGTCKIIIFHTFFLMFLLIIN